MGKLELGADCPTHWLPEGVAGRKNQHPQWKNQRSSKPALGSFNRNDVRLNCTVKAKQRCNFALKCKATHARGLVASSMTSFDRMH
mmetsp:Transcript_16089/g.22459  ORF Transcript_16089/g.22459 Transcript_16089/m.22459 type:complete len:86 (+) Transcript_16089:142-399(+)